MKKITVDAIDPITKVWFGNQIQSLAMQHDLVGPNISLVRIDEYTGQIIGEIRSRARIAANAQELALAMDGMDTYCRLAAAELIRIRQIRAAHKAGELPNETLRQLPVYTAFCDYFEEAPSLVYAELKVVAQELLESDEHDANSEPLSQPRHPAHPVSKLTRTWMELQTLGLACADDAGGAPFDTATRDAYVMECALRIRKNARRAIRIGELYVTTEDVDKVCWVAASEAYLLRSLKAARDSGKLSDQEIKLMPIYGTYHEYFENGTAFAAAATQIASTAGLPPRKTDEELN